MFSRALWITFLTVSLSSFTAQGAPAFQQQKQQDCSIPPVQTVYKTVTVTAPPTATGGTGFDGGNTGSGKSGGGKGGNNNHGIGANTTPAAATSTGNHDGHHTSSKDATKTTLFAATNTVRVGTGNGTKGETSAPPPESTSGSNDGSNNTDIDPQTSLTLDPRVISSGFANDGQDVPTAGQVASLTSTNNFINFCLTVPNLPLTNGKQIPTGSCNTAPIGAMPSTDNMPSTKFAFPANFGTIKANTAFTIKMNIQNMQTGFFVNAQQNYFSAPQQLNKEGQIIGHSHVVVEQLTSLDQVDPTDPRKFAFFKGLNAAAQGGQLTADVTNGLPSGFYRLSSISTAANHQPAIVPIAQHGALDDAIYFTVTDDGQPLPDSNGNGDDNNGTGDSTTTLSATSPTGTATDTPTATDTATATDDGTTTPAPTTTTRKGETATPTDTLTATDTPTATDDGTATATLTTTRRRKGASATATATATDSKTLSATELPDSSATETPDSSGTMPRSSSTDATPTSTVNAGDSEKQHTGNQ